MRGCLDDLLVVELASGWRGPLTGRLLADLGATVAKVERGDGDRLRSQPPLRGAAGSLSFQLTGAGKRSVRLEYAERPEDGRRLRDLVAGADVLVSDEELDPRWLGLESLEQLAEVMPGLIHCSVTPFGRARSSGGVEVPDLIVQAVGGMMATTGFIGDPPTAVRPTYSDHATALYSAAAILAALRARSVCGLGQSIDMAAFDCLVNYLFLFLGPLFTSGVPPRRLGNRHLSSAPWNLYECADGAVIICSSTDEQWLKLAEVCGLGDISRSADLATKVARVRNVDRLDGLVGEWTHGRTRADVVEALRVVGIPAAGVLSVEGLLRDDNFLARGMLRAFRLPDGSLARTSGSFFTMSETPGEVRAPAPALGSCPVGSLPTARSRSMKAAPGDAERELREGPLAGITVLELGAFGAGPFASRLLAELGAEVIKLEPPGGDPVRAAGPKIRGESYPFIFYNLNKRSLVLDLRDPNDLTRCRRLLASADVFIENLGPGAVERLGLGYEQLREELPRLVYCSVSGFGRAGPYRERRAFDTVVQAMSGVMEAPGDAGSGAPLKAGISIGDLITPTAAAVAILGALHWRERSQRGQRIDISMQDVVAWSGQALWPPHLARPTRDARLDVPALPLEATYRSADARIVAVSVPDERRAAAAAGLIGRSGHAGDLRSGLRHWVASLPAAEVVERCRVAGLPAAVALEIPEVIAGPLAAERGVIVDLPDASGAPVRVTQTAFRLSRTPCAVRSLGPRLGERNGSDTKRTMEP